MLHTLTGSLRAPGISRDWRHLHNTSELTMTSQSPAASVRTQAFITFELRKVRAPIRDGIDIEGRRDFSVQHLHFPRSHHTTSLLDHLVKMLGDIWRRHCGLRQDLVDAGKLVLGIRLRAPHQSRLLRMTLEHSARVVLEATPMYSPLPM